ncbi:MAG TPA: metallophosphoesterase [Draconibacterium sp.]|nr:metallophosphoesterase [Draconibacterium sp.]
MILYLLKMKFFLILFCFTSLLNFHSSAQKSSLIVLGDLHYDLLQDHDMDWLGKKPDDLRQVTEEYTVYTEKNWNDFMTIIKKRAEIKDSPVKAVIQLGDLSEGLAGTEEKAHQMSSNTMKAINAIQMPVPWIIAKGNHDVTGPGAVEAFQKYYIPFLREQTNNPEIESANYSFCFDNVQITCIDPWDKETDITVFLESELSKTDAKYKFIAIHQPVIPVTERCWHIFSNDLKRREKMLEVIARHKAIVLCGHLHRYSVVRRDTQHGPIVQVMVVSVVKDRNYQKPKKIITKYGPSIAEKVPEWQSETIKVRKAILSEEAKYVTYYKQTDLPGYAIINIDENRESILLEYYAAFAEKPYDFVDLTKLLKLKK